MAKRGRPAGSDSEQTKEKIINAARLEFAANGYDGASITSIARNVGIAPSAIYHYFQSKEKLYTEVFKQTSSTIWDSVTPSGEAKTLLEAMTDLLDNSRQISTDLPSYSDFLASLPIEAKMHPEFSDLLQQRADHQDRTFRKLASIGIKSGEIDFLSEDEATELIRSIVMGWFFEKHFRQEEIPRSAESILAIFKHLLNTR
ncbi:MAG: TetR/AcrR family transcriptional regulator [Actinomycetota bacterium]|nr:TetR/AcrR family transcriptional regulator [Actinomycetota bacterium]